MSGSRFLIIYIKRVESSETGLTGKLRLLYTNKQNQVEISHRPLLRNGSAAFYDQKIKIQLIDRANETVYFNLFLTRPSGDISLGQAEISSEEVLSDIGEQKRLKFNGGKEIYLDTICNIGDGLDDTKSLRMIPTKPREPKPLESVRSQDNLMSPSSPTKSTSRPTASEKAESVTSTPSRTKQVKQETKQVEPQPQLQPVISPPKVQSIPPRQIKKSPKREIKEIQKQEQVKEEEAPPENEIPIQTKIPIQPTRQSFNTGANLRATKQKQIEQKTQATPQPDLNLKNSYAAVKQRMKQVRKTVQQQPAQNVQSQKQQEIRYERESRMKKTGSGLLGPDINTYKRQILYSQRDNADNKKINVEVQETKKVQEKEKEQIAPEKVEVVTKPVQSRVRTEQRKRTEERKVSTLAKKKQDDGQGVSSAIAGIACVIGFGIGILLGKSL